MPSGALDLTVWDYSGRCYPEVVYVQGGLYLRDYRAEVGAAELLGRHAQLLRRLQVPRSPTRATCSTRWTPPPASTASSTQTASPNLY